uniref:Uncharacterized protein n=1 Tax=Tanacetum cinerariifolium TaxID=118510 RepID=A0A699H7W1_TANCI|nr:hypothetical protein [Tanacetum cinerariifolium]
MWCPYSQSQQKCLDVCKRKADQATKSWACLLRLQVQKVAERCCLDAVFVQKDSDMCCLVPKVAESKLLKGVVRIWLPMAVVLKL